MLANRQLTADCSLTGVPLMIQFVNRFIIALFVECKNVDLCISIHAQKDATKINLTKNGTY